MSPHTTLIITLIIAVLTCTPVLVFPCVIAGHPCCVLCEEMVLEFGGCGTNVAAGLVRASEVVRVGVWCLLLLWTAGSLIVSG
jgi:hypothetical protein